METTYTGQTIKKKVYKKTVIQYYMSMIAKRKIVIEVPKVHDVGYRLFLLEEAVK